MEIKPLICEKCGAPIDRRKMKCEYCGVEYETIQGTKEEIARLEKENRAIFFRMQMQEMNDMIVREIIARR